MYLPIIYQSEPNPHQLKLVFSLVFTRHARFAGILVTVEKFQLPFLSVHHLKVSEPTWVNKQAESMPADVSAVCTVC